MITLERVTGEDFPGQVWSNDANTHVIVEETEETYRFDSAGPGWYWRDEDGESNRFDTLDAALQDARRQWGEIALGPAMRLSRNIAEGRADEVGHFLLEYLAEYGAAGIDAQALANRVFARIEEVS
jgi:hypothetical protein